MDCVGLVATPGRSDDWRAVAAAGVRAASIDCGSHSISLLIADLHGRQVHILEQRLEVTRLGEGVALNGVLAPTAMERSCAILQEYVVRIREHRCQSVHAVGTAALRNAANGSLFVRRASELLASIGGCFSVIDGLREAHLSWRAAHREFSDLRGPRCVLDLGGGSMQISLGETDLEETESLPVGSIPLSERLLKSDPPDATECRLLYEEVERAIMAGPRLRGTMIGQSGMVFNLARMLKNGSDVDAIPYQQLCELRSRLGRCTLAERRKLRSFDPRLAEVIYVGALILECAMKRAGAESCMVSNRGIGWGLLEEAASAL